MEYDRQTQQNAKPCLLMKQIVKQESYRQLSWKEEETAILKNI
jgi:hypothetical protein